MDMLFFEHPLDELMRLSLRIEFIAERFNSHIHQNSLISERGCIESIINLAHILDRPDLKSKYAREFSSHILQLESVTNKDNIDLVSLQQTIEQLRVSFQYFSKPGKIGLNLRDNFFLNTIRQHLLSPGGEADFELPAYVFWLHTSRHEKLLMLQQWFEEFLPVTQAVALLLKLTRSKAHTKRLMAIDGAYHEHLDGKHSPKLVQIEVVKKLAVYPVISAGKYRLNIRFNEAGSFVSEEQVTRDIDFQLTLCF